MNMLLAVLVFGVIALALDAAVAVAWLRGWAREKPK